MSRFETDDARRGRELHNRRALEMLLERFMAMPTGEPGSITINFDSSGHFRSRKWEIHDKVKEAS